jgi:hypothetical protein
MNQWAMRNPEACERGETYEDHHADLYQPCCVCGEIETRCGVECKRCRASINEGRMDRGERPGL